MNLSKAFDTLNHDLLMTKREAYGLSTNSLRYIRSYLSQRLHTTGVNSSFSLWEYGKTFFHYFWFTTGINT